MLYLIQRRNARIILLFIVLAAVFALAAPWVYENVFVRDEDLMAEGEPYRAYDFSGAFSDFESCKDIFLELRFLNDDYVFSELKIKDLNLKGMTVSANVVVKGRIIKDETGRHGFSGKLFSKDITLNSGLIMDVSSSFRITRDELEIESLRFGKSYELTGRLGLKEPYETDLRFKISRADIRELAAIAKVKPSKVVLGVMNGVFYIKGTMDSLFSNGSLESRNGKIGPLEYDSAVIRFEGFGPIINIVDSKLRYGTGTLTMDGYVDLRDIAKGNLFDDLTVKSDMKSVVWKEWDITRSGADELRMTKDISDNIRIGFKTVARDPLTTYYDKENPEEMNLEYKIGEQNLKLKLKDNEEFFGVEHNIKF